ncbi:PTH1 family peptidyl-tRNA hydrolase [[Emmonsia] crescens]|uniref:peptidyl-tRNA hydrolase n=1 Tax=[Emmonsia] crescens TaxID=73230 RepID=A0A2B7ZGT6_9EURO|nr:PTH1 family peptidyl-tRNA hydrolase [Emmonsia crescens]
MSPNPPLFLASIGNPPPRWHKTLHSAGHILLRALAQHLDAPLQPMAPYSLPAHPPPRDHPGPYTARTQLPHTRTPLTLWQSPSLMNVSGPTLIRTYEKWCAERGGAIGGVVGITKTSAAAAGANIIREDSQSQSQTPQAPSETKHVKGNNNNDTKPIPLNLILLHDDLELSPGKLSVRRGGASLSARGHNGIKSVVNSLVKAGMLTAARGAGKKKGGGVISSAGAIDPTRFQLTRIGVGIGRPASREPEVVAEYVLGRMPDRQVEVTEGLVEELVRILEKEVGMMIGE